MTQQQFPPSGQPSPSLPRPVRQLRRSIADRKIGGVCGGIGEYFGVDATLVRVAFVVLTIMTGGGFLLAYLIAFLVMPDQNHTTATREPPSVPLL